MSQNLSYIERIEIRCSSVDLLKLDFLSRELGFGTNRSKAARYAIDLLAERLAEENYYREVEARQCTH